MKVQKAHSGRLSDIVEEICCLRLQLEKVQRERSFFRRNFFPPNSEMKLIAEKICSAEKRRLDISRSIETRANSAEERALEIYEIDRSIRESENVLRAERKNKQEQLRRERYIEHSSAVMSNQSAIRKIRIADEDPSGTGKTRCFYCNAVVSINNAHLDHRKPVASGGKNTRRNTVLTCPSCNLKKGKMTESKFRIKIKEYLKI